MATRLLARTATVALNSPSIWAHVWMSIPASLRRINDLLESEITQRGVAASMLSSERSYIDDLMALQVAHSVNGVMVVRGACPGLSCPGFCTSVDLWTVSQCQFQWVQVL